MASSISILNFGNSSLSTFQKLAVFSAKKIFPPTWRGLLGVASYLSSITLRTMVLDQRILRAMSVGVNEGNRPEPRNKRIKLSLKTAFEFLLKNPRQYHDGKLP